MERAANFALKEQVIFYREIVVVIDHGWLSVFVLDFFPGLSPDYCQTQTRESFLCVTRQTAQRPLATPAHGQTSQFPVCRA